MRVLKKILAVMCMAALAITAAPEKVRAGEMEESTLEWPTEEGQEEQKEKILTYGSVLITSENNEAPTFKAGEAKGWNLIVHNNTEVALENVVIAPRLGDTNDEWPFKTEWQDYAQTIEGIAAGESYTFPFTFEQRADVPTARHTIQFDVFVGDETVASQKFYVNTTVEEKPEEEPNPDNNDNQQSNEPEVIPEDNVDFTSLAGGFSNGGAVSSGGSDSGSTSVPRVIVTGFSTDPAEVRAGSNFALIVHLKNTSKATAVKNMLFDLNAPAEGSDEQSVAPAFLPASGSSSIYLDGIKANGTADISIQLNAKADLLQKPYSVDLSMKYEDTEGTQIEASSSISIPIKQDARFEFSDFEISPESISVGDEANVMCNLYNLGRIKLYNVKAAFEGSCIKKEEVFLGNVESGASASIDAMLEGVEATEGPAKIKMTVSYEDEAGKIAVTEKELELEVTESMEGDMMTGGMEMIEEEQKGFPVLPAAALGAVILIVIIIVAVIKRRKKKQRLNEEEELLDELDRPSEDER